MTWHLIGKLAELDKYVALHPRFAKAFEFLRREDLFTLASGRYEIDGDEIYASVEEPMLKKVEDAKCEAHSKYIDIQVPLSGPETFGLCTTPDAALEGAFKEKDIVFFAAPCEYAELKPGEFAIFFPPFGGHSPCLTRGEIRPQKKLIIKVRA